MICTQDGWLLQDRQRRRASARRSGVALPFVLAIALIGYSVEELQPAHSMSSHRGSSSPSVAAKNHSRDRAATATS